MKKEVKRYVVYMMESKTIKDVMAYETAAIYDSTIDSKDFEFIMDISEAIQKHLEGKGEHHDTNHQRLI